MSQQAKAPFRAVLFDLDDTLLYDDMEGVFLKNYFAMLAEYARPLAHRPNVYAQTPGGAPQVNLVNVDLPAWLRRSWPRFMYLWTPGN